MNFKRLYLTSVTCNEILTKKNSSELAYQRGIAKERRLYGILARVFIIYYQLIKQLYYQTKYKTKLPRNVKIISIYSTLNQKKTIDAINHSEYITSISLNPIVPAQFSLFLSGFLRNAFMTPFYILNFLFLSTRRIGLRNTVDLFSTAGDKLILSLFYTREFSKLIRKIPCKVCIFANDHNCEIRSAAIEFKKNEIKVGYIQHSTVSDAFPSLNLYDFAILDGKQAIDIYDKVNKIDEKTTSLYNFGALRLYNGDSENHHEIAIEDRVNIAVNGTITLDELEKLILKTQHSFPNFKVYIRPHVQQTNINDIRLMCYNLNVHLSDVNEKVNLFLSKSKFLITVSSGVVLDALRNNVLPLLYIPEGKHDYFNFLEHNIALDFNSFLFSKIDCFEELKKLKCNARYFDNCIDDSEYEFIIKIQELKKVIMSYE